jgi:hypothetical protein
MGSQPYPFWTEAELNERRHEARVLFKATWTPASLQADYATMKKTCMAEVEALMQATDNLRLLRNDPDFFNRGTKKAGRKLVDPARFMTIPVLSQSTLEVLGEDRKLAEIVVDFINPERFAWLRTGTKPTQADVERAVEATTELMALQRVETQKRTAESKRQEIATRKTLEAARLTFVESSEVVKRAANAPTYRSAKGIENHNLYALLDLGEFTSEFKVAGAKCDLPVRLPSGFFLPLECKVSGEATNSIKRLIRETNGKRQSWRAEFGQQPYTGAVIAGVFSMTTLRAAQSENLLIFWEHEMNALGEFVAHGGNPRPRP